MPTTPFLHRSGPYSSPCALNKTQSFCRQTVRRQTVSLARKWYAVKVGRKRGVFETWDECENQVAVVAGAAQDLFDLFCFRVRS